MPYSGVSTDLSGVHFADPTHGWAVGDDGTILTIRVPDVSQIVAAENAASMQAALKSIDVSADTIGQPFVNFRTTAADLAERSRRAEQDQKELAAYFPKDSAESTGTNLLNNPIFLSNLNRLGITIYVFFGVTIIVAIYRYSMRLSAHYEACADALELSNGFIDARFNVVADRRVGNLETPIAWPERDRDLSR
jgi:hypothetical protein